MRVTNQALVNNFLKNLNNTNQDLFKVNTSISSGKRVERPEDDAIAASNIAGIESQLADTAQFQENIQQSLSELNTVDSVFGEVTSILIRVRELGVQAANDSLSIDERDAIAVEVNQLLESMVQIGNSTVGGTPLFSGHESGLKPFEVVRGSDNGEVSDIVTVDGEERIDINTNNITRVIYRGDGEYSAIEVDQDLTVDSNVTGQEMFFYDEKLNNSAPKLIRKKSNITANTLLENLVTAKNTNGISAGYLMVKNTRGITLREDTNPSAAIDNSTPLSLLNNGRGIGRDKFGEIVALGNSTLTDSAGTSVTFNTNVPPITNSDATISDIVSFLNGQTFDPLVNVGNPKLRFFIEADQIKMIDNANGGGVPSASDETVDNPGGGQLISTFMQDLGLVTSIQPKTIDSNASEVGMFNDFGGVRFSGVPEVMTGQIQFQGGTDYIEIDPSAKDGQILTYDDGAGNRTPLTFNYMPGSTTIDNILSQLNSQVGTAKVAADIDTSAASSYFEVQYPDGVIEKVELNAMMAGASTDVLGNPVPALGALSTVSLQDIHTQVQTRLTRQDLNGRFSVYLSNGTIYDFNLGDTQLNQQSSLSDIVNSLNAQSNALFAANGFQVSADGQRMELTGSAVWGAELQSVVDLGTSTVAFDIGLLKPFLSVNADFPNVSEANYDFPGIAFDERLLLSEWTGKQNISSSINNGQIRVQDAAGKEKLVDLSDMTDFSTVEDFINLFNSADSLVRAELSPSGYGIRFLDSSGGSGNFFVEDFGDSSFVETLGIGTPLRGAKEVYDGGASVLIDLNSVGDTVHTLGELLSAINDETSRIGVSARVDEVTSQLVFEDQRRPSERGKYRVSVENAIGLQTSIYNLNEGGGINNYKIRITDSGGVSQVIDFQDANTLEDVINRVNLSNEEVSEKTTLKNIEGLTFPLGTFTLATSTGSTLVDLTTLNQSSTMQDLRDIIKGQIGSVQADVHLKLNRDDRTLNFEFTDDFGGTDRGNISITDTNGSSAAELKLAAIAKSSPFESGLLVHRRVNVKASLNDDRTGLKLTDLAGGELRVTEVEGRTTAHDLGLITNGIGVGVSVDGVLRGKNLNVFEKLADELGLSKEYARKEAQAEDNLSSLSNEGAIDDEIKSIRSVRLQTSALNTLSGSVDLNHRLTNETELRSLGGSIPNPEFKAYPIEDIDVSGVLKIESLIDDGAGNYQRLIIDFKNLPDNPTYDDLNHLIQQEIAADDNFDAVVQLQYRRDGGLKFVSDYPIRMGKDDTPAPSPGADALGASTMEDLFGDGVTLTDFNNALETVELFIERQYTGGIENSNFYINDATGVGSLEIDLDQLSYLRQRDRRELRLGDIEDYIELNSSKPATLKEIDDDNNITYPLLRNLGIKFPVNIPFDAANPAEVDTVAPFNSMNESSTLEDFIAAFNAPGANSVFNGVVTLEIADATNTLITDHRSRRLLLRDQTGLAGGSNLTINGLNKETLEFLRTLGVKTGGQVEDTILGVTGIMGKQITGLGYEVDFEIDSAGTVSIKGQHRKDSNGVLDFDSGRIEVVEGNGSTASDLKILLGTGAIGNGTLNIASGNLDPGVDRNILLSEIMPNSEGVSTSFEDQLKNLYIENGKASGSIDLSNPPVTLNTPFKAFQDGRYDSIAGLYRGGVDVGRPSSGFVIQDQFGNQAIVDLSNNLSEYTAIVVPQVTVTNNAPSTRMTAAVAGAFSNVRVGDYLEIDTDIAGNESRVRKFRVNSVDATGNFLDIDADAATFDTSVNNYTVNIFQGVENLHASMDKGYQSKPFFNNNSTLHDLQKALDIAIDKAKRTSGFGVDKLTIEEDEESGTFRIMVSGENGPTITINERDLNGDGILDSSTAGDLGLLRDSGSKGNGSPMVTAGNVNIKPTMAYVIDKINGDLSDLKVTASIGMSDSGPTIDLTSNSDSSYIKVRDTVDGNTASQLGMSSTRSIFQTLIDFRDSLFRNAPKVISNDILEKIGEDEQKILQLRARVGSVVNRFEVNSERLDTTKIELTRRLSDNQDLNITDAIINLRRLEIAQRAALSVGSRMVQQTLLDFLR